MPSILANGHGGRHTNAAFQVPQNVSIHFYCADNALLSDTDAWRILGEKQEFNPQTAPTQTCGPGTQCFEYYLCPQNSTAVQFVTGIQVQAVGRNQKPYFDVILEGGEGQQWGTPRANTVDVEQIDLPSVQGGPAYGRNAVRLSNIAAYAAANGFTDIHWLACREWW
jgi:hypothetical protein